MQEHLKIGLIINPIAGIGGRVALKGSDGLEIQQQAIDLGAKPEAEKRTKQALEALVDERDRIKFYTISGAMGGDLLISMGFHPELCYLPDEPYNTKDVDTKNAAMIMQQKAVDLILFAGGDGTARNILEAVGDEQLCLGIPAGCKIYSAVFTVTPVDVGQMVKRILQCELVEMQPSQVLDINEQSYRAGNISTSVYGEMLTPRNGGFVQAVKVSGVESEELVQQEISAWITENLERDCLYLIGSGSSCMVIKDELGIDGSLLGVDVIFNEQCILRDATEQQLLDIMAEYQQYPTKLIVTVIGGQGILLGRGNHQICHRVIRQLGRDNLIVIASKGKISSLAGQPMRVDTGDEVLNQQLSGYIKVITGYDDSILYPIGRAQINQDL